MDQTRTRIAKAIGQAEHAIREVMIDATRRGEYAEVDLARSIAMQLSRLSDGLRSAGAPPEELSRKGSADSPTRNGVASKPRTHRRATRDEYPRFTIEGDTLTMVGWSKKAREEYSHKVPHAAFDIIAQAMSRLAQRSRAPFTTDDLVRELEATNATVPLYHVYTTLRFLRHEGHTEKRGRAAHYWTRQIDDLAQKAWTGMAGVRS
jgi:hypothetical protein